MLLTSVGPKWTNSYAQMTSKQSQEQTILQPVTSALIEATTGGLQIGYQNQGLSTDFRSFPLSENFVPSKVRCDKEDKDSLSVVLPKPGSADLMSSELSPSTPISFVLPQDIPPSVEQQFHGSDLDVLSATMDTLHTSGWFYEGLSWSNSMDVLKNTKPGTFLVRNSNNPRYLFTLSVQTNRGPTSVRLHYYDGNFRLDATPTLTRVMPVFSCVVKLVDHYVTVTSRKARNTGREQVWIDGSGETYANILLTKPRYQEVPDLKHLARLCVNRTSGLQNTSLPQSVRQYLEDYPYTM